jgi:hypothetical protein
VVAWGDFSDHEPDATYWPLMQRAADGSQASGSDAVLYCLMLAHCAEEDV